MADAPQLFLVTPPIDAAASFAPCLEAALDAADVACVLLRTGARDPRTAQTVIAALMPIAQRAGAAVLIEGEPRLAARLGADGVHVTDANGALQESLSALKPDRIVGVGGLAGRDAAMRAGEMGVDYLMFGGPGSRASHADVIAETAWWAEIFNVPCVGYAAEPSLAGAIAAAGAEFVALGDGLWDRPDAIATILREARRAIAATPEPAR